MFGMNPIGMLGSPLAICHSERSEESKSQPVIPMEFRGHGFLGSVSPEVLVKDARRHPPLEKGE